MRSDINQKKFTKYPRTQEIMHPINQKGIIFRTFLLTSTFWDDKRIDRLSAESGLDVAFFEPQV
jgi:hypothetical protein